MRSTAFGMAGEMVCAVRQSSAIKRISAMVI
jgi:hypothetical protein